MQILKLLQLSESTDESKLDYAKSKGFDVDNLLYHGTRATFSKFDRKFNKTAKHIYTTPDPITASNYGNNIYVVAPKITKLADLIDDYDLLEKIAIEYADYMYNDIKYHYKNIDDIKSENFDEFSRSEKIKINRLIYQYEEQLELFLQDENNSDYEFEYEDSHDEIMGSIIKIIAKHRMHYLLQSGKIYDYDTNGSLQDDIIEYCYSLGYNVVRFIDYSTMGSSESYVFDDPEDLIIVGTHDN